MWLFTTFGFFSIVQKKDTDFLTIRARKREHLIELVTRYPLETACDIVELHVCDYRYRIACEREDLMRVIPDIVRDVTYSNFKDAVASTLELEYVDVLHNVWDAALDLDPAIAEFMRMPLKNFP